jgi:PAS domain S-box-containing protein
MFGLFENLRLNVKVSLLGVGSVLITAVALVTLAVWQSSQYNTLAQNEVDQLIDADLDHITQGVYNLVQTENEAVQQQVNDNLNVAGHILANAGGVSLSKDTITWIATNQFTNEPTEVQLPKLLVGNQWLGQNTDPAVETAIVDEVQKLVGDTATLFQRMDEDGSMLRVATTVKTMEGKRAIGTYIPAINPDGAPNPVIAAVVKEGEIYRGRAFVVNAWYLTAYQPIRDNAGHLVGMLYVGVKQANIESRVRQAILQTQVGKTGYVYVLGGTGEERGHYIISKGGARDGEDIWDSKDAEGRYFIQSIVNKAITLKPGEMATERYPWQNIGEPAPRWKVVRIAYYAPWDWVIGTSAYEDELQTYRTVLSDGRAQMTRSMVFAGLLITLLIGLVGIFIAWTIARPVWHLTKAVETIIQGDLNQVVDVHSRDEMGVLAGAFNRMALELRETLEALQQSEQKLKAVVYGSPIPQFVISSDHRVIYWNKALEEISGIKAEEIIGTRQHWRAFYNEERPCMADLIVDNALEAIPEWYPGKYTLSTLVAGSFAASDYFPMLGENGKWLFFTAAAISDSNGCIIGAVETLEDITERKRAEEALQRSEANYRSVIENIQDTFYRSDAQGNLIMASPSFLTLLGYESLDDCLGKPIAETFYYEPQKRAELLRQIKENGSVTNYEVVLKRRDGAPITVEANSHLYFINNGTTGIEGIFRDITKRRLAEKALKESEEKYRLLVEQIPAVTYIYKVDEASTAIYISPQIEQMLGYTSQEWTANPKLWRQRLHPNDCERVLENHERTVATGEPFNIEYRLLARDGRVVCIRDEAVMIRGETSQYRFWQGILLDITERKQAEEALSHERTLLERVMETSPIGITTVDRDGQIRFANLWAEKILGFKRDEIAKRTYNAPEWKITDFAGNSIPEADLPFARVMSSHQPVYDMQHAIEWPDGRRVYLSINAAPLLDEAGQLDGMVAAINDITEQKRIEDALHKAHEELEDRVLERTAQLEAAYKELEAFSYSISHDLRAPLRAMDGFSHILLEDYAPKLPSDGQRYLHLVQNSATQMGRLIDDLLAFSRLSRQPVNKQSVDMKDLVEQTLKGMERERQGRQVNIKMKPLYACEGDPAMLRQVWVNLLSNAFKFTRGRKVARIEIGSLKKNGEFVYFIKDNGAGFDMAFANKLFGVFQRLHSEKEFEGTGVGLAIVQRIIHRHSGRVWAEAQEGQGATFYFTLPQNQTHVTREG